MVKREFVETVSVLEESLPRVAFAWSAASLSRQFLWKNILRRVTRTSGIFVFQSEFVETVYRWKHLFRRVTRTSGICMVNASLSKRFWLKKEIGKVPRARGVSMVQSMFVKPACCLKKQM